ncbi:Protein of unknown function [Alteromonadaceae bacterium Bs31]|nr:Protein of unknown function [Alteromonadaceae bacterium Bs31]
MEDSKGVQLTDQSIYPDDSVLEKILGRSFGAYVDLLDLYKANGLHLEWRYYKDGGAWLCKLVKNKKTIVWMSAWIAYVEAAIYVPLRMLDALLELDITEETKNRIIETKNVGKSKPCIFKIKNKKSIKDFEKVMQFKINKK